ncbi:MAG: hypothetical protein GXO15_05995, partial [Crenarchaeota archaeon]|nr:hypothetical protein [Thermoproteota archaeon]
MPGFSRVVRVEIAAHAHATEDVDKVVEAVMGLLPETLRGRVEPLVVTVEGHHGNPITRIVVRLEGVDAEEFLRSLASRLGDAERRILRSL